MKTVLDALEELRGFLSPTIWKEKDDRLYYILPMQKWGEFVAKCVEEYASELTAAGKTTPRAEDDLDSIAVGSESTRKVKIYYNSRTDTAEDEEGKIRQKKTKSHTAIDARLLELLRKSLQHQCAAPRDRVRTWIRKTPS